MIRAIFAPVHPFFRYGHGENNGFTFLLKGSCSVESGDWKDSFNACMNNFKVPIMNSRLIELHLTAAMVSVLRCHGIFLLKFSYPLDGDKEFKLHKRTLMEKFEF